MKYLLRKLFEPGLERILRVEWSVLKNVCNGFYKIKKLNKEQ